MDDGDQRFDSGLLLLCAAAVYAICIRRNVITLLGVGDRDYSGELAGNDIAFAQQCARQSLLLVINP